MKLIVQKFFTYAYAYAYAYVYDLMRHPVDPVSVQPWGYEMLRRGGVKRCKRDSSTSNYNCDMVYDSHIFLPCKIA